MQISDSEYSEESLGDFVERSIEAHANSAEELAELALVRREMAIFRQDWEAYFPNQPSDLFTAYKKYLEARYDAAFVLAHGAEMGMPDDLFHTRLRSVDNRRVETLRALKSEDSLF